MNILAIILNSTKKKMQILKIIIDEMYSYNTRIQQCVLNYVIVIKFFFMVLCC